MASSEEEDGSQASDEGGARAGSSPREGATPVVARRASASAAGPATTKTKLRRSNRKRGSKPAGLKLGDAVEGNYGPLVATLAGVDPPCAASLLRRPAMV